MEASDIPAKRDSQNHHLEVMADMSVSLKTLRVWGCDSSHLQLQRLNLWKEKRRSLQTQLPRGPHCSPCRCVVAARRVHTDSWPGQQFRTCVLFCLGRKRKDTPTVFLCAGQQNMFSVLRFAGPLCVWPHLLLRPCSWGPASSASLRWGSMDPAPYPNLTHNERRTPAPQSRVVYPASQSSSSLPKSASFSSLPLQKRTLRTLHTNLHLRV